jgi:hypothetical protein
LNVGWILKCLVYTACVLPLLGVCLHSTEYVPGPRSGQQRHASKAMTCTSALLGVALLVSWFAMASTPAHAETILGCEKKDADPVYCRDGKPPPICLRGNVIVWADTRLPVLGSQLAFILRDEPRQSLFPCPENLGH